jgi:hypothetical protein
MTSEAATTADPTMTDTTTLVPTSTSLSQTIPTLIVPAWTVEKQPNYNTGSSDDPVKDMTLVSILLSLQGYPWMFVKDSQDAIGQILDTFPKILATALEINPSEVKTLGLELYQPVSWDGSQASLGTQWLGYIPHSQFQTLQSYIATTSSPIYNQKGINGKMAAQIDSTYPIGSAANLKANAVNASAADSSSSSRKRDIIIGVCVGIGGLLWIILVLWIYKRVKRANERTVNKRLSEHMSMFSGRHGENPFGDERRHSNTPSIAASEIDDRPSSFYASPLDNYPAMRRRQVESYYTDQAGVGDTSPTFGSMYGPNGNSWLNAATGAAAGGAAAGSQRVSQNPFDDVYSPTSPYPQRTSPTSPRMASRPQRRSVQKGMISQPTLQGNSLEFNGYDYRL